LVDVIAVRSRFDDDVTGSWVDGIKSSRVPVSADLKLGESAVATIGGSNVKTNKGPLVSNQVHTVVEILNSLGHLQ
jgi:hypothetical protein